MKKKIFSLVVVFLLALSVVQLRAPVAKASGYSISGFSISPKSGSKGVDLLLFVNKEGSRWLYSPKER